MPTLSDEQLAIVNAVKDGKNVIVDAVAGSGKTTTILGIVEAAPDKQFLVITYNRRLCDETRNRISGKTLTNINMHTYHSHALSSFDAGTFTDEGIQAIVAGSATERPHTQWNYDVIILDEVQDMTPLFYQYVTKIAKLVATANKQPQLVLLGDRYQEIYGFKGADSRFLTHAASLYPDFTQEWNQLTLKTSYRINRHMASFVNTVMLKEPRITVQPHTNQEKVQYYICDVFDSTNLSEIAKLAIDRILAGELHPHDVAFIAYSIKSSQTLQRIEKRLLGAKIPVHTPAGDDACVDERAVAGKVLMCTMHQMKGLEREMIIVLGFDEWLCEKNVGGNSDKCSNLLYVAATRARKYLILVQHYKKAPLPFVSLDELEMYRFVNVVELRASVGEIVPREKPKKTGLAVRDLLRFLPASTLTLALECLKLGEKQTIGTGLVLPDIVDSRVVAMKAPKHVAALRDSEPTPQLHELVADLNGVAIPAMFEHKLTGKSALLKSVRNVKVGRTTPARLTAFQERLTDISGFKPADYAEAAALQDAIQSGYSARVEQLPNFKWLDEVDLEPAFAMLAKITKDCDSYYEVDTEVEIDNFAIHGRIDIMTKDPSGQEAVWEIKCTSTFATEHILQCAIYMYSHAIEHRREGVQVGHVANLVMGEVQTVSGTPEQLKEAILVLLNEKYKVECAEDDARFIEATSILRANIGTKKGLCPIECDRDEFDAF